MLLGQAVNLLRMALISTARFRRLARDYERLPQTLAGLHFVAFAMLMALRFVHLLTQSA